MRDGLEEGGKRGSDCSTMPSLRSFATTQRDAGLLDHHALFEGARGRGVVLVFLGDYAFFSKPAGEMRDGATVGTVVIAFTEATWGTGLFQCCAEGWILLRCECGERSDGRKKLVCCKLSCRLGEGILHWIGRRGVGLGED